MTVETQKKGQNMRPSDDYNDPDVVSKIEKDLQSVGDKLADSIPEPEDQRRGDESKSDGIQEPAEPTPEPKDTDEIVLPERLLRAAIHQGMTTEEVQEFFKTDPKKATKVLEKIYESTNKLSKRWAELGRVQQPHQQQQQQPVQQPKIEEPKYKGIDIKKIREEHGNDPLVDVVEQLDTALKTVLNVPTKQEPSPIVQSQIPQDTFQEDIALWQEVNNFFSDSSIEEYNEAYGPGKTEQGQYLSWQGLTPGQYHNRMAVLTRAEQILTGAELQGENLSVQEALNLAHLLVTEPIREQIVRTKIKNQIQQRSKGITLKPSGVKQIPVSSGKPKTDAELETTTEERLANIKW